MTFDTLLEIQFDAIRQRDRNAEEMWEEGYADGISNNPPASDDDAYLSGYGAGMGVTFNPRKPYNPTPWIQPAQSEEF
ncbi:MAG: hypothetical protein LRZ84_10510 [Desertifilum sp.]|nr:hypothetical protein [Desertifilum sp.]